MKKRIWTEEEDKLILELWESASIKALANKFGTSYDTVRSRATELGLGLKEHKSPLTKEQLEYVRESFPDKSIHQIKTELGVPWLTVKNALNRMGIDTSNVTDGKWTEEDIATLKELAKRTTIKEIAARMGRSEAAITIKIHRWNIEVYSSPRKWSEKDIRTLKSEWGNRNVRDIAKRLHRDTQAVLQQAHKLGLDPMYKSTNEFIHAKEFEELSGITEDRMKCTLIKSGFPLSKEKKHKKYFYYVHLEKAKVWMRENQDKFDATKVSEYLFNPEPKWLLEKRKKDIKSNSHLDYQITKRAWSKAEENKARDMRLAGKSFEEIGKELNRSSQAVSYRLRELGLAYRGGRYWTGAEFKFIAEHYETMTDKEIAKHLKRTEKSVQYHRSLMGYTKGPSGILQDTVDVKESVVEE